MPQKFSAEWFLAEGENQVQESEPLSVQERMDNLFSFMSPRSIEEITEEFDRDVFSKFKVLQESEEDVEAQCESLVLAIHEKTKDLFAEGIDAQVIEEGIFGSILNFFKGLGKGTIEAFKEKAIGWILGLLGIEEGSFLHDFLKVSLANVPLLQVPKLFTDCNFTIGHLTKGLAEYFSRVGWNKIFGGSFGQGYLNNVVGNAIGEVVNNTEFMQTLQKQLAGAICPKLGNVGNKLAQKATQRM